MPLPFLKPKSVASLIISQRKPDGDIAPDHSEDNPDSGLMACSEDLIRAVHAKDASAVTAALKAAYELMDSSSGDSDDNSFESQNMQAAKDQS